jgi:hypothetical protein
VASISGGLHHSGIGSHPKNVPDVLADALSRLEVVELDLDGDVASNDVEPASKAQDCRQFGDTVTGEVRMMSNELIFYRNGQ